MKEREFVEKIRNLNIGIFTISDISRIIGKSRGYATLYAKRLADRDVIVRIEKGRYTLPETDSMVIATNVVIPSYISFLSALSYYRLTTQIPTSIQVVAGRSKKEIMLDRKIIFIKFDKKRIFGYRREKMGNGYAFIGEIEKILVDILFMPRYCPIGETLDAFEKVDIEKLLNYAFRMNSIVLLKRLGYLLELKGVDVYDRLKGYINRKYDMLNPLLPPVGKNNSKWMLKLNEVL